MATIAEVRGAFEAQKGAIEQLDADLTAERKRIKQQAFMENRDMTAAEKEERRQIGAIQFELGEALQELGLGTLDNVNNASDLDPLITEINAIQGQLNDDLERLRQKERFAAKAADVAGKLASGAQKLLALKAALPI